MKKIALIITASAATLMFMNGCSATSTSTAQAETKTESLRNGLEMSAHIEKGDESTEKNAIYVGMHSSEDMLKAIKNGSANAGWEATEYKSNAVIVEKILSDKTISTTIVYHNGHISGDHENAPMSELLQLRKAIVEELKKRDKEESESKGNAH